MNELRDIHLPDAITWWPPAIGWWLLLLAVLALLIYFFRPTFKKRAHKLLRKVERQYAQTEDAKACLAELSLLLRWIAVTSDPNSAGLTGEKWLACLDAPFKKREFSEGVGKLLLTAPYQQEVDAECIPALLELAKKRVRCL